MDDSTIMDLCWDYRGQPSNLNFPGQYGDGGTCFDFSGSVLKNPYMEASQKRTYG